MPNYYVNEAAFALPDKGFVDVTLHRLESPVPGGEPLGLEIRRLPIPSGKSLRELVDGEVAETKTKVNGFAILDEAETTLAGIPALLLRARRRALDVAYYQLHAHVAFGETWITFLVTGPYAERAACDATLDRILQSLEWRRE